MLAMGPPLEPRLPPEKKLMIWNVVQSCHERRTLPPPRSCHRICRAGIGLAVIPSPQDGTAIHGGSSLRNARGSFWQGRRLATAHPDGDQQTSR